MGRKPKDTVVSQPIPSIQKAFSILEFFCSTNRGHTISETSRIFGIPVSTCSAVLYTLVMCGYLTRDEAGFFSLTMKVLGQANKFLSQMGLNDIAEPELKRIVASTELAAALFIKEGNTVVCIAKVEGTSHIRTAAHVGKQMPMHATCTGKVLLTYLSDEELESFFKSAELTKITGNTITSESLLRKELAKVRSIGYATDDQEYGIGVRGISAPVFDSRGRAVAAISASGAAFEVERDVSNIVSAVKSSSLEVSKSLGYSESVVDNIYRNDSAVIGSVPE